MPLFAAHEFHGDTAEPTTRSQVFLTDSLEDATQHVLCTARLTHGRPRLGPSGRVIYRVLGTALAVTPERTGYGHPNG